MNESLVQSSVTTSLDPDIRIESDGAAPRDERSLKSLAIRGAMWTAWSYLALQLLTVASSVTLSYLLVREVFGLMMLVYIVTQGLAMFSDIGIGPSIIQNRRSDQRFLDTAWTIQAVRGVVLWLCACILAWPAAWMFAQTNPAAWQLVVVLPVAALYTLIVGFNSTSVFSLNRDMTFGKLTVWGIGAKALTFAVTVAWALWWPSVWAIVAGTLAAGILKLVLSHTWLAERPNRFAWDRDAVREMMKFGKWIFLSTLVTFFAMQADRLLLGNLEKLEVLGVYSFAIMLASKPGEVINWLMGVVLFPALSRLAREKSDAMAEKVLLMRSMILPVAVLAVAGVVLLAPFIFGYVYHSDYVAAGWMAPLVCIFIWFSILTSTSDRALLAVGNSRSLTMSNVAGVLVTVAASIIGWHLYDLPGFIVGYGLGKVPGMLVIQYCMSNAGMPVHRQDIHYCFTLSMVIAAGFALPELIVPLELVPFPEPIVVLAIRVVLLGGYGILALRRVLPILLNR